MHACHNNGIGADNRLSNLRWDTAKSNMADQILHGTNRNSRKTHCKRGHEFTPKNTYTTNNRGIPGRMCKTCSNERGKQSRQAEKENA